MKKLLACFIFFLIAMQVFSDELSEGKYSLSKMHGEHWKGPHKKMPLLPKINCHFACARRCSKSSRKNVCDRACKTCCFRCRCVPQGTYGNKNSCPCYASLRTHGNRPKCP